MQLLGSHEERQQLEDLDAAIEQWILILRDQAESIDAAQLQTFLDTAQRLALRLNDQLPPSLDASVVAEIRGILIGALRAIEQIGDDRPLDILDDLLLRAESIRHIVRDALDEDLPADAGDAQAVLQLLGDWLPRVSRKSIARLVGVDERTLQRWSTGGGRTSRRLFLVAKLVLLLTNAWTPEGVVAWFDRPRRELRGKRPIDVIDDIEYEQALLYAAREGRSQHGS